MITTRTLFFSLLAAGLLTGANASADVPSSCEHSANEATVAQADAMAGWSAILDTYVTDDGGFRYEALMANAEHVAALDAFVAHVAATDPSVMERDEKLAFLINAYNALTVKSVLELWPVTNVLEEDGFFDGRTHNVGGTEMTLNTLENYNIRDMGEPRIHFLVNCASTSCPPLADTPITAANLESMLESHATAYVNATTRVVPEEGAVYTSEIFNWFQGDFGANDAVREFIASHLNNADDAALVRDPGTTLAYDPYDWSINAR